MAYYITVSNERFVIKELASLRCVHLVLLRATSNGKDYSITASPIKTVGKHLLDTAIPHNNNKETIYLANALFVCSGDNDTLLCGKSELNNRPST